MRRIGILFTALFGLAGCNDDATYVCVTEGPLDARGCFLCRGDDCTPQPPPDRAICLADEDCAVGEVCTGMGCVAECTDASTCPIGTTCSTSGLCLNPTEEEPSAAPFRCQFNFECGDARICIDGDCLQTCLEAPCPDGQECIGGACRPCTDQACLASCTEDAECAEHEYCSGFQCVPDTRPEQFCPEHECQPGRICLRGQCRTPCESDEQCARTDAVIRFCAPVEGQNLCVRSIEVLAECQLSIDCGLGEECVDGACSESPGSP